MSLAKLTPQKAAEELLRIKEARNDLISYAQYIDHKYKADSFHRLVADKLMAVSRGEINRLMILAPPRHGKSYLTSVLFPSWFLAQNPGEHVIASSYNQDIATLMSKGARAVVENPDYSRLFPHLGMSKHSSAATEWALTSGQKYQAVGVGSGLTGRGGHLIMVDDPIKGRDDAESDKKRQDMLDWFREVLYTRLMPGGRLVLIQTKWHFDDLAGRLERDMEKPGADQWDILKLPAIAEEPNDPLGRKVGEPLAPSIWNIPALEKFRDNVGERGWASLYQQRPVDMKGGMFKPDWFKDNRISEAQLPQNKNKVRAWDLAASANGDWTAGVLMSRDDRGVYYIEDIIRMKGSALEVETLIQATAARDGRTTKIIIPQDPGQAGIAQSQALIRSLAGYNIRAVRPGGSKTTRAYAFAAQCEALNVKLVERNSTTWIDPFLTELASFPLGKHDDQIDAASDAFNNLISDTSKKARTFKW
jgi:predicted phage terminase large subunit-like protein